VSEVSSNEHVGFPIDAMAVAGEALDDGRIDAAYINTMGGIQQALLAIHVELRRANDARDAFYREASAMLACLRHDDPQRPEGVEG
jgi:hypothetical protein